MKRHVLFLALTCAMILILCGSVSATDLNTTPLSNYSNIYVNVANDEGVSFNTNGNNTYYIQHLGSPNGGFNAVHIANDSSTTLNYGGSTNTTNQSGTLYATDTGGRGYQDDVVLMLAVNGTIPDNFTVQITAKGYNWTPTGVMNAAPALSAISSYGVTLNETFTKNDFIYGLQNWKPTGGNVNYPIFIGEDMNNTNNMFYLMFIDTHAGLLGSNYPNGGNSQFINNGAVEIDYNFTNLESFAAFNIYAWNWNTTQGQGMLWTNSILPGQTGGPSEYTVQGIPATNFTANTTSGTAPLNVQFTDSSSNNPTSWSWDFGDGTTSTDENPTHTYTTPGTYTVSLTAGNAGGNNTITQTNYITVNWPAPVANFSANVTNGTAPLNVQFTDSSSNNPTSWSWDFGDGTTSTEQNPTHTYTTPGNYTVSLTAGNAGGNNTIIQTNYVAVNYPAPVANFSADKYWGINNVTVHFYDNSTYSPTSWLWNFGDGTTSTEQNPTHIYSALGSYNVSLTATNYAGNNTKTISKCINVLNNFNVFPSRNGENLFVANDAGVKYDMPNGVTTPAQFGGVYPYIPQTYYVAQGAGGTNPIQLSTDPANKAGTFTNTTNQTGTFYITFNGGIQHLDDAILMLAVNGTIADDFSVTITSSGYTYTLPAPTTSNPIVASLTNITYVTNALNETFHKSDFIYQQNWRPYNTQDYYPIYNGENVSDPNNQFHLMFIDLYVGAFSANQIPDEINSGSITVQYTFHNLENFAAFAVYGWFSACNWGTGIPQGSYNAVSGYNVLGTPRPVANLTANTTSGTAPLIVQFTDSSSNNPTSWSWDFGDGITSTSQNPTHTYTTPGTYTVSLTAGNAGGNNTIIQTNYITVNWPAPVANFTVNSTSGLNPLTVQFNDTSYGNVTNWSWDFGDGTTSTGQNPTHIYTNAGIYAVKLTVTGPGGVDTITKTSYITVKVLDTTPPTAWASLASGYYNTNKLVTLKMSEPGIIYYTTNGSTPTTASKVYTGAISITSTAYLKFFAVDTAGNKSPIYIKKYIIDKIAPKVISTYPKNYARGVSRTSTIAIKFSENIKASINWSKIYMKNLTTGKTVSISKWISGNTLYIKTTYRRNAYNWYRVYIPYYAVKDYAGNKLARSYTFIFKTGRY